MHTAWRASARCTSNRWKPAFLAAFCKGIPLSFANFFYNLNAQEIEIAAPAFLFDPEFEAQSASESAYLRRTGLRRYSTNSGTAAGTTLEDAQVHALMELIERDALSIELLATVFSSNPRPLRRISHETLTDDLMELVGLAESETGGIVTIWSITSDTRIPAILVRLTDPSDMNYGYFGSGASIYIGHAIERALTEAVQGFHIYTAEHPRPCFSDIKKLKHLSPYRRCLLEYGRFEYQGGEQNVSLSMQIKEYSDHPMLPVKKQIEVAINALKKAEIPVYGRVLFSHDIHVAQMYSPTLERFFLASAGILVVPGKRGRTRMLPANQTEMSRNF
ncbi:YcaO-like family protein [Burkholderia ambifaria]|uniref:YcaO-like family protein n=1 Tax=Burkholderia ambifaria TaxID=152480 RepID=UPI001589E055|nr:YcaO-like family protein [Burkholderia ambifaria]